MASEVEDTPFERYLVSTADSALPLSYATSHWTTNDQPRTRAVQFQMPQFMQGGPPLLAQGGGVEVLPAAMFNKNNLHTDGQPSTNNILKPTSASMNRFISEGITDPQFFQQANFPAVPGAPLNLPLYSASGFDVLSILSRVVSRANPQINLGPVDLTTSFCVSDPRRYDHPIIYCSPSFCTLTGYTEGEILGRNCRFLQQPPSPFVQQELIKGARREFTNEVEVATLAKAISTGKECQISLMNYRKDGNAFLNLVTVIPIWADDDPDGEAVYHMGFQIDLSEQPNAILDRLLDGRYLVDYTFRNISGNTGLRLKDKRFGPSPTDAMSQELVQLLKNPAFQANMRLDPFSEPSPSSTAECLAHFLLSSSPDFIHVLSLKGSFLYCSPGVRGVLGWEGTELVGKSLSDICHASDLVAVLRELKEGSTSSSHEDNPAANKNQPRPICLLFRALKKVPASYDNSGGDSAQSRYVWLECRGRLYSEPGKGRKAIILSGRARKMWAVDWSEVQRTRGPLHYSFSTFSTRKRTREGESITTYHPELWGLISLYGTVLTIGDAIQDVAGWDRTEVLGTSLFAFLEPRDELRDKLRRLSSMDTVSERLSCSMLRKDGTSMDVGVFLYRARHTSIEDPNGVCPAPTVFQIQPTPTCANGSTVPTGPPSVPLVPSLDSDESVNWSWQYEIQQVRFENVRLAEEVSKLEHMVRIDDDSDMRESKVGLRKEPLESAKYSDRLYSNRALVPETATDWPSQYNAPMSFTSTLSSLHYSRIGATANNDGGDAASTFDQSFTSIPAYSVNWAVKR